jgi:hypothetical protein
MNHLSGSSSFPSSYPLPSGEGLKLISSHFSLMGQGELRENDTSAYSLIVSVKKQGKKANRHSQVIW